MAPEEAGALAGELLAVAGDRSLDPADDPAAGGETYHASFMAADDGYRRAVASLRPENWCPGEDSNLHALASAST